MNSHGIPSAIGILNFTKPILLGGDEAAKAETRATTAWVLAAQMLKILHPFMPYITEELWAQIVGDGSLLISTSWPELPDAPGLCRCGR